MSKRSNQSKRCAVYTRKSTEEGLQQAFNSLDAQREACEAYIKSQAHESWKLLLTRYDDGGFSGGSLDRPGVRRLIEDVRAGAVDVIVVYKIDRLTRSLSDFARLVEVLEEHDASFVSVTQHFNTTTSMGRLTLNVLLSFAQFEREVTGERIRDKIAASKKKGMWMGGPPPLGYDIQNRKLVVNDLEAKRVRLIYERYLEVESVTELARDLEARGVCSKVWESAKGVRHGGNPFVRGALYKILRNPLYRGYVAHQGDLYPGEHEAIVPEDLAERVSRKLQDQARLPRGSTRDPKVGLLLGLLRDSDGDPMLLHHANKKQRRYYYYVSRSILRGRVGNTRRAEDRIPVHAIEDLVRAKLRPVMEDPEKIPSPEQMAALVDSVQVTEVDVRIALRPDLRPSLVRALQEGLGAADVLRREADHYLLVTQVVLRRRRGRKQMFASNGDAVSGASAPNAALVKSLVRAHRWREELERGAVGSYTELAKREHCSERHVRTLITLAFLAPDITEAILDGTQPAELALRHFGAKKIPFDWAEQRRLLGFADAS